MTRKSLTLDDREDHTATGTVYAAARFP